jgi:adenine phosphoribosyltransferase
MASTTIDLRTFIRDVPDFPKAGIIFKDITPLLGSAQALDQCIGELIGPFRDQRINKIAAVESRGFIFGACVAREMHCGFVPIRKPGKLPWTTRRHEYTLEYGTDALEMHDDAVGAGDRVLIVDDVLATGGTAAAAVELVRYFDAEVAGFSCLIELDFLSGRDRLPGVPVHSVLRYS